MDIQTETIFASAPTIETLVESPKYKMSTKIFISHTASDEQLASALVACLLSCMILDDSDLRCTSVAGHKLPGGCDFAKTLLEDIGDSSVVIGLITKASLTSGWVLFELGATWGAKKNLKPLVADSVDLKTLPGPLSGRHVAKISTRSDVSQFIEEIAIMIGAKQRTAAKISKAIEDFLEVHNQVAKSQRAAGSAKKVETKAKEPQFCGMPFSELLTILANESVTIPAKHTGNKDKEMSLFELFVLNAKGLSDGYQSNWDRATAGGFLYEELGLRLLPYGLVHFEKLPAAQAKFFKRLTVSPEGHRFLLHFKRSKEELP